MSTDLGQTQTIEEAVAEKNRRFAEAAARSDATAMASVRGVEMGIRGLGLETLRVEQVDGLVYEMGRYTLHFESTPTLA